MSETLAPILSRLVSKWISIATIIPFLDPICYIKLDLKNIYVHIKTWPVLRNLLWLVLEKHHQYQVLLCALLSAPAWDVNKMPCSCASLPKKRMGNPIFPNLNIWFICRNFCQLVDSIYQVLILSLSRPFSKQSQVIADPFPFCLFWRPSWCLEKLWRWKAPADKQWTRGAGGGGLCIASEISPHK